jgi:formate dehydrogenase assembly factor FdhD
MQCQTTCSGGERDDDRWRRQGNRSGAEESPSRSRNVAVEKPIAMSYCGLTLAVMMATPDDPEDFGVGFSTTERIFERAERIPFVITIDTPQRRIRALPSCSEARDSSSSHSCCSMSSDIGSSRARSGSRRHKVQPRRTSARGQNACGPISCPALTALTPSA